SSRTGMWIPGYWRRGTAAFPERTKFPGAADGPYRVGALSVSGTTNGRDRGCELSRSPESMASFDRSHDDTPGSLPVSDGYLLIVQTVVRQE
ncbi:MAG: hypothetical protein Q4C47_06825, partial [Planctomycetia bacterium]|nr:hypothetical protein [Planctomycetia bacterium]